MNQPRTFLQVLFLFILLSPLTTLAQWNTNTSVNLEISSLATADMVSVPTSDGKTWIAFYHENTGNYDMRAQLIDENGYKLLGPDGILVSNQSSGTAIFVFNACVDNQNNLIIGCQDQRTGSMKAVLYKISPTGSHLWNPLGVVLAEGLAPYPAALSNNDIVVAWNDDASSTLKVQKISSAGSIAWTNPITILVGSSTTTRGQIVGNLNEKFTLVYQKYGGGISTNLYAQMFNSSGTALYAPLQICNQTTAPYRYYSITSEADTTYFGYYSSTGLRFNSFTQRINPNGTIPWGMNGSAFNTYTSGADNYQMETSIGHEPGSPYIWSVCSFSDPNQDDYGVYVQKYLKSTGARQFTDMGKPVYQVSASRDIRAGEIAVVNDNPMFASYDVDYKIYATRLNTSGDFIWPGNRVEISSTTTSLGNPKGRYGFTKISENRCAGIWTEDRGSGDHAYAQGISVGGLIGIDVTTQGGVPATISVSGGTLQLLATIFPTTASQSVNWAIIPVTGAASINASGLVTALVDGTVYARATAAQDNTMSDSLLITISGQIPIPPAVVTLPASSITLSGAVLNGSVNANNYSSNATFEWGLTSSYGNTATATPGQVTGNSAIAVQASLSGLLPGTTYHFRCVATNSGGTTNGQDLTFTTLCQMAGTMSSITGPASLCAGTTGQVYSVDPFPGATSYIWTIPTGATIVAGANSNSITVNYSTVALSGNMSVYATDGLCTSLPSPVLAITVTPLPVQAGPITGVQVVCEGEQGIHYTIPAIPGVTNYVWTVPAGAVIASGQNTTNITVNFDSGSTSGNVSVYGTNTCGTGAASDPLPVTVNPLPGIPGTITGPEHICKVASGIQYSVAPVSNAFGYNWTLPAGAMITSGSNTNAITVTFTATAVSGNITVTPTNGNCIGQPSAAYAVTVDPTPSTPVITRQGDTLISSADAGNQWYLEGVLIPGATGKQHIAVVAGNYTVVVTLNNCSSAPSASVLVLPVLLDESILLQNFSVYPQPSRGQLNVIIPGFNQQKFQAEVYNTSGQMLRSLSLEGRDEFILDLSDMNEGLYVLVVRNHVLTLSKRICLIK